MLTKVTRAVMHRDFKSWFGNPIGYVFILLFVLLCAVALTSGAFFSNNLASLDTLSSWFPLLLALFVPAVTMGMWASERANGTQELLFTLPAKDSEILLGKYLAAVGIYAVTLLFTLTLPLGLLVLGSPDFGLLFSTYLGYLLLGVLAIAVAMIGSQLTHNLTVAFILGVLAVLLIVYLGWGIGRFFPQAGMDWETLGTLGQFQSFARGVISVSGLALFAGLTVWALYLNLLLLSRRLWRIEDGRELHGTLRAIALVVGTVSLMGLCANVAPRFDSTVERVHSLSADTRELLRGLDSKRPVVVTAYVSPAVPTAFESSRRTLLNLLDQFEHISGGTVQKRLLMPEPGSPEARDAQKNHNIHPAPPQSTGGDFDDGFFLGFVVQSGLEEVAVPFLLPGMSVEYELMRSVRVAANVTRKKVGVLKTDVDLYGGVDYQTFQQKPTWQIVEDLKLQYKIENVDPEQDYPKDLEALVAAQPSSLTQPQMDRLKAWVLSGKPTLLIEDSEPFGAPGTAASDQKGGRQNPFGGPPQGEQKGDFGGILGQLGLSTSKDDVVWDLSFRSIPRLQDQLTPECLILTGSSLNQQDRITSGLERVIAFFSGHLRIQDREGLTHTPLLQSRVDGPGDRNGTIRKLDIFQFNPFMPGSRMGINLNRRHRLAPDSYNLAVRVAGKPKDGAQDLKVIVVADLDLIGNNMFGIRKQSDDPNLRFDNVEFILNCIDDLSGDDRLIELRKRRPRLRQLDRVMASQAEYEATWAQKRDEAEDEAKKELDKAQARLDETVKKIEENPALDENAKAIEKATAQNVEQKNLEVTKVRIEDEKLQRLEEARHDKNAAIDRVQNGYQVTTIIVSVLPALLVGLFVFLSKLNRERAIVPAARKVGGAA